MTIQTANLGKVKPLWRGEFSASPTFNYKPLDQLTYEGTLYVVIQESDGSILPSDNAYFSSISGVDSIRLNSVVAFTISQYAGGDSSAVAVIVAGLSTADIDYFIDSDTYQVFAKNGVTGTFSDPLDFDSSTGIDSGLSGTLSNVSASFLLAYLDKKFWPTIANDETDPDHDIVFSAGKILSADGLTPIDFGGMTKQLDATWTEGTGAGGLFSGVVAADETYHCFVIVKDSDGSVDCGFDTDPDCANIPTGYTSFRRVHSVLTDSGSNIIGFVQVGDNIELKSTIFDLGLANANTTALTQVTISVPIGVLLSAKIVGFIQDSSVISGYIGSSYTSDEAIASSNTSLTNTASYGSFGYFNIPIQKDSIVSYKLNSTNVDFFRIKTLGWIDGRVS